MPTTKEILIEARKLIDAPEKWTKATFARNKYQETVSSMSPEAVCFCAVGALTRAKANLTPGGARVLEVDGQIDHAADLLMKVAIGEGASAFGLPDLNDEPGTTHVEILAAFDKAIEAA